MKATLLSIGVVLTLVSTRGSAQGTYKKSLPDSLANQAKVSEEAAASTALSRVPKGQIESVELERERGRLIYSYDIKTTGRRGIDEVNVNAMTGKVLAVTHESPAAEKKEAAAEARMAKPKKP